MPRSANRVQVATADRCAGSAHALGRERRVIRVPDDVRFEALLAARCKGQRAAGRRSLLRLRNVRAGARLE